MTHLIFKLYIINIVSVTFGGIIVVNIDIMLYNSLVSGDHTADHVLEKINTQIHWWINRKNPPENEEVIREVTTSIAAIARIHEKGLCETKLPRFCLDRLVKRDLDIYIDKINNSMIDISQNYCDNLERRSKINSARINMISNFSNREKKYEIINNIISTVSNN